MQEKGDDDGDVMRDGDRKSVALDIGLDSDTMKAEKLRKFEEFKRR